MLPLSQLREQHGLLVVTDPILLKLDGQVERPLRLTFADLEAVDDRFQIADVSRVSPGRQGDAVTLAGLLELAGAKSSAEYLGLHSTADDFHASIPLAPVRAQSFFIYRLNGQPLTAAVGGPIRFFIPDHAECHTDEVDECANVKFVEHVELTAEKGYDNRPEDDDEHEALHRH